MAEGALNTAVRMPWLNKVLFASDHVGMQAISYFRQAYLLFFLVPAEGEGPARVPEVTIIGIDIDARLFAGIVIGLARFMDAFTDPLIGWWTDRTHTRWGRRIPFILLSTPFYAAFAALIWFLPEEGASIWNLIFMVIVLELFLTAHTMSSGALEALVPEVTQGGPDRNDLVGLIFVLAIVGAFLSLGVGGPLKDWLGYQTMGIILAVIGIFFRYVSLSAVWKYAPRATPPARVNFWRGMRQTLRNPQFVYFLPTFVMFTTGVGVMMAWVPFYTSQMLGVEEEGTASAMIFVVVIAAAVVSGLFCWLYLMNRKGIPKRRVYGYCLVGSGVAFPLLSLTGLISDGGLLIQGLILAFIAGLPMAAVFMLPKGLTADIADYDALLNGERREAMFYATQNFFEKLTHALPPGILSLVLLLGETTEDPLGLRLAPVVAGVLAVLGITLWHRYRLPDNLDPQSVAAAGLLPSRPATSAAD